VIGRFTSSSIVVSVPVCIKAARLSWQNSTPMTRSKLFSMNNRSMRSGVAFVCVCSLVASPAAGMGQFYRADVAVAGGPVESDYCSPSSGDRAPRLSSGVSIFCSPATKTLVSLLRSVSSLIWESLVPTWARRNSFSLSRSFTYRSS
jgi:hypothetical protein